MRWCCSCGLQTQSGERWIFRGGDHSHTLMWSNGKRLEESIWLCLDVQRNQAGSRAGNGTPAMSPGNYVLLRQVGDRNPVHCRQPFSSCLWRLKQLEHMDSHLSQGESCHPATHLVQKWERRRGKRRRQHRTTQSCLAARLVKNPPAVRETRFHPWVGKAPWRREWLPTPVFLGFLGGSAGKESACKAGDPGSIPREGKGYLFQYSGLENSMDYIVHGVTNSQTEQLSLWLYDGNKKEQSKHLL